MFPMDASYQQVQHTITIQSKVTKEKSCPNSHLTGALSLIWLVIIFTRTKYLNSD